MLSFSVRKFKREREREREEQWMYFVTFIILDGTWILQNTLFLFLLSRSNKQKTGLPDEASMEAASWVEPDNDRTVLIDASTAFRVNEDWVYGFPGMLIHSDKESARNKPINLLKRVEQADNPLAWISIVLTFTFFIVPLYVFVPLSRFWNYHRNFQRTTCCVGKDQANCQPRMLSYRLYWIDPSVGRCWIVAKGYPTHCQCH